MNRIKPTRYLGILCPYKHEWEKSGKSLRLKINACCVVCNLIKTKRYGKERRERLSNIYIIDLLKREGGGINKDLLGNKLEVLINVKRAEVLIKRKLKEVKNGN